MIKKRSLLFYTAFCLPLLAGCASSYLQEQALADYDNRVSSLKTIGVLNPDIVMLELTAGGVTERIDEWDVTAARNFSTAIKNELSARMVNFKMIVPERKLDPETEDIYYLNRAITESLNWNTTYRKLSICADERICRDYSLGDVENILQKHKVDALLIVYVVNEMETAARTSARRRSRAGSFWIGMVSPVTFAPLRNPGTYVGMALIDRSGSVLWYSGGSSGKGYDLRDPAVVDNLTRRILSRLWIRSQE